MIFLDCVSLWIIRAVHVDKEVIWNPGKQKSLGWGSRVGLPEGLFQMEQENIKVCTRRWLCLESLSIRSAWDGIEWAQNQPCAMKGFKGDCAERRLLPCTEPAGTHTPECNDCDSDAIEMPMEKQDILVFLCKSIAKRSQESTQSQSQWLFESLPCVSLCSRNQAVHG